MDTQIARYKRQTLVLAPNALVNKRTEPMHNSDPATPPNIATVISIPGAIIMWLLNNAPFIQVVVSIIAGLSGIMAILWYMANFYWKIKETHRAEAAAKVAASVATAAAITVRAIEETKDC